MDRNAWLDAEHGAQLQDGILEHGQNRIHPPETNGVGSTASEFLEFVSALFDDSPVGVFLLDASFRIVYDNHSIRKILGLTEESVLHRDMRELLAEKLKFLVENGDEFERKLRNSYKTNHHPEKLLCHVSPGENRQERWLFYFSQPVKTGPFAGGRFEIYHDRTTEHLAEQQLLRERTLWNSLIHNIPDSVYIKDSRSRFLLINEVQARILGVDEFSQAIGKTDFDFFPKEHAAQAFQDEQEIMRTGKPIINKLEKLTYEDGRTRWFLTSKIPVVDAAGRIIGTMGSSRDITELKENEQARIESEQRFKLLFEASHDGIVIINEEGKILDANSYFQKMTGLALEEIRKKKLEWFWNEDTVTVANLINMEPQSGFLFEASLRQKNGGTIPVEVSVGKMRSFGGMLLLLIVRDVSQRKATEEAIRESEHKFRILAEESPNMIFIFQDEKLVYVNSRCQEVLGYSREYFLNVRFDARKIFAPESVPVFKKHYKAYLKKGALVPDEYTLVTRQGKRLQVIVNTQRIRYDGREAVLGIITDITQLKETEKKIRASEALYRSIFENTGTATAIVEKDRTLSLVNSEFAKLAGGKRKEIEGKKNWAEFVLPEDQDRIRQYHELRRQNPSAAPRQYEFRFRRLSGEVRNVLITVSMIPGTERSLVSLIDITDQKKMARALQESEEKYRNLIENSNDAIYLLYDRKFELVNKKFTELFGITLEDVNQPGFDFTHLISPRSRPFIEERAKRIARGESVEPKYEFTALAADGREIEVETSVSYIRYKNGIASQGIIRDITERKRLEAQLNHAQKMEAIGRLAGGVAHDFNNLLTAILGYTQLLLGDTAEQDPRREDLLEIQKAAERAAVLTQQLLAFSRKQAVRPQVLSVNAVISDMNRMLRLVIGEDVELVILLDEEIKPVKMDRGQLEQVVMNLAVNARDAMPNGGKLTIQTRSAHFSEKIPREFDRLEQGEYVQLSIEDTGKGIEAEVMEHLFEPFFTTKEVGKGTGLGLATVYGIVKQSGGDIFVLSEPGRGASFHLFFPALDVPIPENQQRKISERLHGNETILLVEDEDSVRELTQSVLERHGYTVLVARYGDEGLQLVDRHRGELHLIITDVIMPRMSGVEMVRRLNGKVEGAKVLFVSGYTEGVLLPDQGLAMEQHFLQKPFAPQTLLAKVREILDQ